MPVSTVVLFDDDSWYVFNLYMIQPVVLSCYIRVNTNLCSNHVENLLSCILYMPMKTKLPHYSIQVVRDHTLQANGLGS